MANKQSLPMIQKKYGYPVSTTHKNFQRLGLPCRSVKENGHVYKYNYHYFDAIDTQEKAYFLGLLYADGYVTSNAMGIALKSDDIAILEYLLDCMESDAKPCIYTNKGYGGVYKPTEYCRVIIRNTHLRNTLVKHGVLPHKSQCLLPPSLDEEMISHFIRGFMDGDGSIWGTKQKAVSFTGTTEMLSFIGEFAIKNGIIKRYKLYPEHHSSVTYSLKIGGNIQAEKFLDLLYKDATVYLERKHQRYLQIKEHSHLTQ